MPPGTGHPEPELCPDSEGLGRDQYTDPDPLVQAGPVFLYRDTPIPTLGPEQVVRLGSRVVYHPDVTRQRLQTPPNWDYTIFDPEDPRTSLPQRGDSGTSDTSPTD